MKIIIIGAGLAGLAFGAACQRVGIAVTIYEKARELRNIGGGILLWPHGQRYLSWLGLASCLTPFAVSVQACRITGHQGQTIFSEQNKNLYDLIDGDILPIDRHQLQQALLSELADNTVILNKSCVAIQQEADYARVLFADGTEDCADMIVGADGIHSVVRQSVNDEARIEYAHHCWWGGILSQHDAPHLSPHEVQTAMGVGKMCITWPTANHKFMWYLPVKMPLAAFNKEEGLAQLQTICADWNDDIYRMVMASSNEKRFHLPIYTLAPQSHCTRHRVVLIGDAAHTLGPVLGQGASFAMEDAFALFHCLQTTNVDVPSTLKHYETFRRAIYQRMAELENSTAAMMVHDDKDSLMLFEEQIGDIDLVTIYQNLIPLVDEGACLRLTKSITSHFGIDGSSTTSDI